MRAQRVLLAFSKAGAVHLRDYREADLPVLHALDQACFPPGIAYNRVELRSFLEHPSSFTKVAWSEASVVGFAIVRPVRRRFRAAAGGPIAPALHILTIDVDPGARRQGVGAQLMEWMIRKAGELRLHAIVLEVAADNLVAQRFYEKFGFEVRGRIPGYYNGETDALEFERLVVAP